MNDAQQTPQSRFDSNLESVHSDSRCGRIEITLSCSMFVAFSVLASFASVSLSQEQRQESTSTSTETRVSSGLVNTQGASVTRQKNKGPIRPGMASGNTRAQVIAASFHEASAHHEQTFSDVSPSGMVNDRACSGCCDDGASYQCSNKGLMEGMLWRLAPGRAAKWITGEYLYWGVLGNDLPPLVTTSPLGTLPATTGVLGQPSTSVLFGDDSESVTQSGFRISGGWWLDGSNAAMEIVYSGLPSRLQRSTFSSSQHPLLARPVFDTTTSSEAAMLVSHPAQTVGSVSIANSLEFQQVDLLRRVRQHQSNCTRLDTMIGLRLASYEERLRVDQSSTFLTGVGQIVGGTRLDLFEQFSTRNHFAGFVIGGEYNRRFVHWSMDLRAMLSLGNNRASVDVSGQTITTVPNAGSATFQGGLLAQQTNIGRATRDQFQLIPEFYVGGRTFVHPSWEASMGYTFMYWSDALRPGNQIDTRVSQFPPEPTAGRSPRPQYITEGIIIHGLQAGLTFRF